MRHAERACGQDEIAARALGVARRRSWSAKRDVPAAGAGCDRPGDVRAFGITRRDDGDGKKPREQGDRRKRKQSLRGRCAQFESFGAVSLATTLSASSAS